MYHSPRNVNAVWLTPSEPTKCLRDGTCGSFARSSFLGVVAASTCTKPFSSISHYNTSSPCPISSKLRKTIVIIMPTDATESDRERDRDDREKDNMDRSEMGGSKQKTSANSKSTDYFHYLNS
jgi:hypothetical protein